MSDPTIEALRSIQAHAAENGAAVDRVEVGMRVVAGETFVEFTAHYCPVPLAQPTACIGYRVGAGEA